MQVEVHLLGTASRWLITTPRARIGRDPGCEIPLPPERYPMVSREHAILTTENGRVRLSDNHSTNGTFVNGAKIANAMLTKLDRFQLGKDGPEFEIKVIEDQPAIAPTIVTPEAASETPTRADLADPAATPTRIAKPAEQQGALSAAMTGIKKSEAKSPEAADRTAPVSVIKTNTREDEQMIEQKLNSLRNLAYLLVAMVAVLLGVIFYQSQQIDKNRGELNDMRRQAQNAVAQFTPALDQRLNALEKRLDQADTKMKETEDQFVSRLNNELPRMLDKYVDRKLKQLGEAAPKLPPAEQK